MCLVPCLLLYVEQLVHECVDAEGLRTLVRTPLENVGPKKIGAGEEAVLGGEQVLTDFECKGATVQDKVDDGAIDVACNQGSGPGIWLGMNGKAGCKPLAHPRVEGASEGLVVVDRLLRRIVRTTLPVPRVSALRHVQPFVGQHSVNHAVSSFEVIGEQLLVSGHREEVPAM